MCWAEIVHGLATDISLCALTKANLVPLTFTTNYFSPLIFSFCMIWLKTCAFMDHHWATKLTCCGLAILSTIELSYRL